MAKTAKRPVDREKLEQALAKAEADKARLLAENALQRYRPYDRQKQFHEAGAKHRERLLMAGNQLGKTLAGAFETAMHLTGRYPEWWKGKRFDCPIMAWAGGDRGTTVRDTVQAKLVGLADAIGTGAIPKDALLELVPAHGVPGLLDTIRVRHVSGGASTLGFKTYESGREKWQGTTLHFVWLDEEAPFEIYSEALTRTNIGNNPVILTFTPLLGVSETVRRFLHDPSPDRHVSQMTIDDVQHYSAEEKARIIASYAEHELEARTKGIPVMGSGRVFRHAEDKLLVDPFECPTHWPRIGGVDFGWTHYAAFCELWWDRDLDTVYLVRTLRLKEQTPLEHCQAVRHWNLQWAWPHDGRNETLAGAGVALVKQYRDGKLDMLFEHAQFPPDGIEKTGGTSVEAGIQMMNDRMRGGRWKVFRGQNDGWLEEYRLYHRDPDGKLVKKNDDAISASRYALMMLRHARTDQARADFNRPIVYRNFGIV